MAESSNGEANGAESLACFDRMPVEIIAQVAQRLGSDDLFNLRLTSRTVSAAVEYPTHDAFLHPTDIDSQTFDTFTAEYFTSKCFIVTTDSLKVLVQIAQSEALCTKVRTLYISPAVFHAPSKALENRSGWDWTVRQQQAWTDYVNDQKSLRLTGRDCKFLTEALRGLSSLRTFEVVDSERLIETPTTDVRGKHKAKRTTGRSPMLPQSISIPGPEYERHFHHVVDIYFRAIARSQARIPHVGVRSLEVADGISVRQDLATKTKLLPALKIAFQNTCRLKLTIDCNSLMVKTPVFPSLNAQPEVDVAATRNVLKGFANTFGPMLTEIDLRFDCTADTGLVCNGLLLSMNLANLRTSNLTGVAITAQSLMAIITKSPLLQQLHLTWFNLTHGSWIPILNTLQKCQYLEHLHLMFLQESGNKAYFLMQKPPPMQFDPADPSQVVPPSPTIADDEDGIAAPDGSLDANASVIDPDSARQRLANFLAARDGPVISEEVSEYDKVIGDNDFVAPSRDRNELERGYYVCLSTRREVTVALPVFIKQYNVGETIPEDLNQQLGIAMASFAFPMNFGIPVGGPVGGPHLGGNNALIPLNAPTANNPGLAFAPTANNALLTTATNLAALAIAPQQMAALFPGPAVAGPPPPGPPAPLPASTGAGAGSGSSSL